MHGKEQTHTINTLKNNLMKKVILFALFALCSTMMLAQTITVKGTVIGSEDGMPIIGAYVLQQGTNNGTSTDIDGNYVIEVPADATLIYSSVGFTTQQLVVNGRTQLDVMLKADAVMLDDVMVVAYGTAKKGTYTGAASLVKADAIKDVPSVSFESALNGKVAGLQITQSSGQAGSAAEIRIRGIGSMNASNEPLYVIDGVPVTSGDVGQSSSYTYSTNNVMSTLNPSDIESITVLKDAAASSLYGSRAANGVVMITTKRGKIGKPTVTLKASWGFTPSFATNNYEVADTYGNMEYLYEVFHDIGGDDDVERNAYALKTLNNKFNKHGYKITSAGTGRYDKLNITTVDASDPEQQKRLAERADHFFDWEDALLKTAVFQTYDISVSGGSEKTSYYSSLSYTKDKGRVQENEFQRISARVNLNQKIGNAVEFATNINIAHTDRSGFNDTRNLGSNYYLQTRNLLWGVYWPTDYKTGEPWTARYGSYAYNALYYTNEWDNFAKTFKMQGSETLTIHILPELTAKTIFSYDYTDTKDHIYYSANHFNGSSDNGKVHEMATNSYKLVSSTTLNYVKDFGEKHSLNVLAGFEAEKNETDFQRSTGSNLPSSSLPTVATAGILDASAYSWGNSMVSILSKAEYNYDGRYYVSASYRRDGSSRLSEDARWGDFWSVAGSWKINNENFLKDVDWISNLRLRASYGINGTLPSNNYGWRSLASFGSPYNQNPGAILSTVADSNLSWETSYNTNIAVEAGFWDQRLYGTIEYFNRDSKDLLQDVPISTVTGFSSTLKNVGEVNNHGVEIEIGGDIIRKKDFTWDASITATMMKSKVTKLYGGQDIRWYDPTGGDSRAQYIYREGESMLALFGYEWAGIDPQTGKNWYYSNNNNSDATLNGRNVVYDYDEATEVILGDVTPKVYGGFNTSISWKGLSLGLNFIYKIGGKLYDGAQKDINDDGYYWERTRSQYAVDNRWKQPGDVTLVAQVRGTDLTDAMENTSRMMYDASFLRLKTVSLGYTFPQPLVKKAGLSNARLFFSGTNLLTWANYTMADPEVNAYGTRGWETPFGKTYTFGLELTF